jgi:hypothetical protein
MRTAIATAIIVAIGLDVVATAIGADKVGEKTHWYPPWLVGVGEKKGRKPRWLWFRVFRGKFFVFAERHGKNEHEVKSVFF